MGYNVPRHFVNQYNANVITLIQQKQSKLEPYCEKRGFTGENFDYDRMGPTSVVDRVGRHADTQFISTPHDRRWGTVRTYDWAELVDKVDKLKMLYDPTSPYAVNAAYAFNRKKDDIVIAAAFADVMTGDAPDGSSYVLWANQTGQIQTEGGTNGLTVAKLLQARETKELADVDPDLPWTFVASPKQITNLLNTTEVKSADYNTVKALAAGAINSFMGFEFIISNRLLKTGNMRRCLCMARGAIVIGVQDEPNTTINQRPDKNNATQIHIEMTMGAVRTQEALVMEVQCYE